MDVVLPIRMGKGSWLLLMVEVVEAVAGRGAVADGNGVGDRATAT